MYTSMQPYADNFIPVIPVYYILHTEARPFCFEPDCPCHADEQETRQVKEFYDAGLITAAEAELIFKEKTI